MISLAITVVTHLITQTTHCTEPENSFLLHFVKYPPHWKIFVAKVVDLNRICVSCYAPVLFTMTHFWKIIKF